MKWSSHNHLIMFNTLINSFKALAYVFGRMGFRPQKEFEDEAAKQLQEKGFEVIRYPGRFEVYFPEKLDPAPLMNFFNMVTAHSPNGTNLIISMGCPDQSVGHDFKKLFFDMLQRGGLDLGALEIYFLNYEESQSSLMFNGGISCRVKTIASTSL